MEARDGENDLTPLHWAVHRGHDATIELLISKGASIETKQSTSLFTPLITAAISGYAKIMQLLLAHGANLHSRAVSQRIPLHYAAARRHFDTIRQLLNNNNNTIIKSSDTIVNLKDGQH